MDDLLKILNSPVFWVATILAGIAVNLVTHFGIKYSEKLFSRWSTAWQRRIEKKKAEREHVVAFLRESNHAQTIMMMNESRSRHRVTLFYLQSLAFMSLAIAASLLVADKRILTILQPIFVGLAIVSMGMAMGHLQKAARAMRLLKDAMAPGLDEAINAAIQQRLAEADNLSEQHRTS
jgi:hypothetical protein